ncbi:MAG TPA: hypothetical protein VEB19_11960 [Gemmatimonadaceae bacterium]|nr:hypothetical protein [Gemmatimonadaceae bacterium]
MFAAFAFVVTPVVAATGQSSVTVSPFVSYIPSAATNPLAGFALTFGGTTGLALRSGAEMSISNPPIDSLSAGGYRPWGADADVMLFLGGLGGGATVFSRSLSPYAFAGIGMMGGDSAGTNVVRHGWSYGLGAAIPLGLHADVFAEARWRMSEYVLPTSQGAPDSKSAMRFGLSFHVGGGSAGPVRSSPRGRRHRVDVAEEPRDVEYVVTPAPAEPQVVVVTQQPAPPPQVVVVEQEREPEPVIVVAPERSRHGRTGTVVVAQDAPVIVASPERTRPPRRVYGRAPSRATMPAPDAVSSRATSSRQRVASPRVTVRSPARTQVRTQPTQPTRTRVEAPAKTTTKARAAATRGRVPVASTRQRSDTVRVTRRPR